MSTEDKILETVIDIKGEVGTITGEIKGVKEHLRTLNGSIKSHDLRIDNNKERLDVMKGKAKIIAVIAGFVATAVIAYLKLG